jgi:thiol-disulfide isomerase/thioredoxin
MTTGLIVVIAVLLASSVFALWRKRTDGRVLEYRVQENKVAPSSATDGGLGDDVRSAAGRSGGRSSAGEVLRADQLGRELGRQATLVQFSTAFCQPCRATKVVLAAVAATAEGVLHIEVDAESHLDLVREVGIMRTPTTLILDAEGRITARATGVPRKDQVLAAIGRTLPA